ncbi:hypothetical protein LR948_14610 [Roseivivax sp. GX 12232]|uniref:hypothetical protein n=1 Tax=Roseivivax sp. GX 12232 TaxID=2900547 RepID=UPI001E61FE03|nr:hypothetical protein [Roseivivax sp. GX 12232]MCE0506598.1 hypothetical protein [Roseivivax sp. GX 12232]
MPLTRPPRAVFGDLSPDALLRMRPLDPKFFGTTPLPRLDGFDAMKPRAGTLARLDAHLAHALAEDAHVAA